MHMLIPFSQINIYANEGLQLNSSVPQLKIQPFKINTVTMYLISEGIKNCWLSELLLLGSWTQRET